MEKTVTLPKLLTTEQICEYLSKSPAWAERARWTGEGPAYVKLGRHVRYRAEDVEAWVNGCVRTSTSDGGTAA